MTIDIIGAGIGGLTTAIALKQKGFAVRVFEQASVIKPVGAGIILAHNAMQVYDKLGLKGAIEEKGNPISSMNITQADLKPLSKIDLSCFEQKFDTKNIAIHRGKLQQILLDYLDSSEVYPGHRLSTLEKKPEGYSLKFENGVHVSSRLVLGIDGLHSVVRKRLFPASTVRNAKQICWRGVTNMKLPSPYRHELNEAWGRADRFGFVDIQKDQVYWYALRSYTRDKNEHSVDQLADYFGHYHPVIRDLIASTPKDQINTAEICDLKPIRNWFADGVCLMGDAAHATTPNMGQGACQAIEDALLMAECLYNFEPDQAFDQFQKARRAKAHKVVKTSWLIGKMAHWSNPFMIFLRNQLIQSTPDSISRKQNEKLFQLATV